MKTLLAIGLFLTALVFLFSVAEARTPIDFKKWQLDDTTFSKQIGGNVRNYQKPDNAWAQIVNNFQTEGDSVFFADKAVLRTRVNKNGTSTVSLMWDDITYTVTQKLLGVGWINTETRQNKWIDSIINWSNFSVDSNICKWTGISPGVDYRVRKNNGTVEHGIFFKPAFLDSAVVLYNQRSDSLDIALANVMIYTLSANIDDADSAIGDVSWRRLKDFGEYSFNLSNQRLHFPGSDTLPRIPVRQYWERRGGKIICIEYVMMRRIKQVHEAYPTATIWHNDTKKVEGTTNVEDVFLYSGAPDNNYGANVILTVRTAEYNTLIRAQNIASELGAGATISAAVCSLYCYYRLGGGGNAEAFIVFKPWNEGTYTSTNPDDAPEGEGFATWNDWSNDDEEWTTAGCNSADDGGSDNSGDGTGADRTATAEDTQNVTSPGVWHGWDISSSIAQDWYDGTKNEEGIVLIGDGNITRFRSTENGSNQPFWVFTYTTDGEPEAVGKIMRTIIW